MKLSQIFTYPFYKQCWKMLFLLMLAIVATKFSKGLFGGVIVLVGLWGAMTRRPAYALICFAVLPFMVIMNPMVFAFGRFLGLSARFGLPVIAFAMLFAASQRRGRQSIPLLGMLAYILISFVSSIDGYCPKVSYLKLINFVLFLLGIYVGTKNIDKKDKDLQMLRAFFFAFSVFIVAGSLALHFIRPFAAHYTAYQWYGAEAGEEVMLNAYAATGSYGFLCGVTNHSQCLGPTAACIAGWVLCDMLFVEKKFMVGHVLLLVLCPIVLYMTKSRTCLLAFMVVVGMVTVYCVPKFRVSPQLKVRIRSMITTAVVLLIFAAVASEITHGSITKWVLKYKDDDAKAEITVDELTRTRQGTIEVAMADFKQNPLLGKGFQVSYEHQFLKTEGKLILSAPVEKGFMPTMILGETGIVGALAFLIFLVGFYNGCAKKKYWVTMALMTTFLATNLGEATFFSPGGTGGPEWIFATVGGFVIDMTVLAQRRREQEGRMAIPPQYAPMPRRRDGCGARCVGVWGGAPVLPPSASQLLCVKV